MNHNISNVEKILAHAVDYTNTSIESVSYTHLDVYKRQTWKSEPINV